MKNLVKLNKEKMKNVFGGAAGAPCGPCGAGYILVQCTCVKVWRP